MTTLDPRALELASKLRCTADIARPSTDGYTYLNDACRALVHEASAALSQPQAGEPGQPAVFIQKEVLDALLADKTATGSVSSGLLRIPFGNPVALYASPQPALAVKGLGEWRRGYCDERVTIEQASTGFGSIYQVRVLDGIVWLDFPDSRKSEFGSDVDDAKAAAQADFETRIRSALSISPATADGVRKDHSMTARYARLDGICSRILWLDATTPAMDNDQTKLAFADLAEYLFAQGIDEAIAALPAAPTATGGR